MVELLRMRVAQWVAVVECLVVPARTPVALPAVAVRPGVLQARVPVAECRVEMARTLAAVPLGVPVLMRAEARRAVMVRLVALVRTRAAERQVETARMPAAEFRVAQAQAVEHPVVARPAPVVNLVQVVCRQLVTVLRTAEAKAVSLEVVPTLVPEVRMATVVPVAAQ